MVNFIYRPCRLGILVVEILWCGRPSWKNHTKKPEDSREGGKMGKKNLFGFGA